MLGQCVIELGRAETYVVRSALNMTGERFNIECKAVFAWHRKSKISLEKRRGERTFQNL